MEPCMEEMCAIWAGGSLGAAARAAKESMVGGSFMCTVWGLGYPVSHLKTATADCLPAASQHPLHIDPPPKIHFQAGAGRLG